MNKIICIVAMLVAVASCSRVPTPEDRSVAIALQSSLPETCVVMSQDISASRNTVSGGKVYIDYYVRCYPAEPATTE